MKSRYEKETTETVQGILVFAGIGGFDLGLEKAGMEVVFQCEINKFCQKVLRKNWSKVPLHTDITRLNADEIPESNVWCGGFPCQDVSSANQGKRKGLEGARSGLFYTYAKLIEERKPEWLIIENVPGLLNSHNGQDFKVVIDTLVEFGYGVSWRVLMQNTLEHPSVEEECTLSQVLRHALRSSPF